MVLDWDSSFFTRWVPGLTITICNKITAMYVYVVVNFLSQVIFVFLLFLGMIMYANEVETKEK